MSSRHRVLQLALGLAASSGCSPYIGIDGDDDTTQGDDATDDDTTGSDDDTTGGDDDTTGGDDDTTGGDDDTTPPGLRLDAVNPSSGPALGGTAVLLTGSGFVEGLTVRFGGAEAPAVEVASASQATATTPPGAAGAVDVQVVAPDTSTDVLPDGFRYEDAPPSGEVDWCNLQYPGSMVTLAGSASDTVYGRVHAAGITDAGGPGAGVLGELGYGPTGTVPADATWWWTPAAWNTDADGLVAGDHANDEYLAALPPAEVGDWLYAYRFSVDAGESFTYCDSDGSGDGWSADAAGTWFVLDEVGPPDGGIGWAVLQWPLTAEAIAGDAEGPDSYGRVFVAGSTDLVGVGPGILAEVGLGPEGSDPSADPGAWSWSAGTFNVDADGLVPGDHANDEYVARLPVPAEPGTWHYGWRFSADGGAGWFYADGDPDGAVYDVAYAGVLTVLASVR